MGESAGKKTPRALAQKVLVGGPGAGGDVRRQSWKRQFCGVGGTSKRRCPAAQGMDTTVGDQEASERGGSGITIRQAGAPELEQKSGEEDPWAQDRAPELEY